MIKTIIHMLDASKRNKRASFSIDQDTTIENGEIKIKNNYPRKRISEKSAISAFLVTFQDQEYKNLFKYKSTIDLVEEGAMSKPSNYEELYEKYIQASKDYSALEDKRYEEFLIDYEELKKYWEDDKNV